VAKGSGTTNYFRGKRIEIKRKLLDLIFIATEPELKEMTAYAKDSDFVNPIYYRLSTYYLSSERLSEAREAAIKIVKAEHNEEWIFKAKEILKQLMKDFRSTLVL